MIPDAKREWLLGELRRHGADPAGAAAMLEAVERETDAYLHWRDHHAADLPLAKQIDWVTELRPQIDALARELDDVLPTPEIPPKLRGLGAALTGTTLGPLQDVIERTHADLCELRAILARVERITPRKGRRKKLSLAPIADTFARAWATNIGKPTTTAEGPFEEALRAVLAAAAIEHPEDLHPIVLAAVKGVKKAAPAD